MTVLEIRILGNPVLRKRAKEIDEIDDDLRALAEQMFETMYAADGVGLAGPQVGVSKRIFVMDIRDPEVSPRAIVNPVVVERAGLDSAEEGCLSVPGVSEIVERAARVVMEGLDIDGNEVRIEAADLLARCIQHEIDHLDGILFLDRVSPLKRKMLVKKFRRLQEEDAQG